MGSGRRGTTHRPAQPDAVPDPISSNFGTDHRSDPDALTDSPEEEDVPKAELARRLNASIYKVGQSLKDPQDEEFELSFYCACGCMAAVKRSLRDYVIRGAVVEGHSRPPGDQTATGAKTGATDD